jgi:DNA repair protein RadC
MKKNIQIKNLSKHQMPREKLIEKGVSGLRDDELMAILVRAGIKGKDVFAVSKEILSKYPKKKLLSLDYDQLSKIKGIGTAKACLILAAFELTKRALEVEDNNLPLIESAKDAMVQLQELRNAKKEHLVALYLDARNRLVCKEIISVGTLDQNLVHPREVFKPAIDNLSVSLVVAHNHPSGDLEPSISDIEMTKKLVHAGKILDIGISDHIIVTKNGWKSLRESNLIEF